MSEAESPRGEAARRAAEELEQSAQGELEHGDPDVPLEADEPPVELSHPPAIPDERAKDVR